MLIRTRPLPYATFRDLPSSVGTGGRSIRARLPRPAAVFPRRWTSLCCSEAKYYDVTRCAIVGCRRRISTRRALAVFCDLDNYGPPLLSPVRHHCRQKRTLFVTPRSDTVHCRRHRQLPRVLLIHPLYSITLQTNYPICHQFKISASGLLVHANDPLKIRRPWRTFECFHKTTRLYTTLFTVQRTAATKQFKKKRKTTIDSTIRRTHLSDSLTTFPIYSTNSSSNVRT